MEQIAGDGVRGTGGDLPFLDKIQASFGDHDVSGIRAHTNHDAAEASESLGAVAFATGNHVAFGRSPDLHTAAHEAAHVIQQRGGVSRKGAGEAGDAHERHADQVADAVVAGEPAGQLLDGLVAQGGPTPVVQRKQDDDKGGRTNPDFVNDNASRLIGAIMDRIEATPLTQPHPRLRFRSEEGAKSELALAISHYIHAAPDVTLKQMMKLSYPANLLDLVDTARRGPAGSRLDMVKIVIATAFDEPLVASIRRMGTRAVVQLDLHKGQPVLGSSLVASSPLDGVVADLLVNPRLIDYQPAKKGAADDTGGRPFAKGTRFIQYEWQGARDPNLWNWIKVTSPADATVEDVANTPFVGDEVRDGSEQAYRIAASPPYFGIPFETARLVEAARAHAPSDAKVNLDRGPGSRVANPNNLAMSALSDDATRAQAPSAAKGDPPASQTLSRIELQIGFMNRELEPWRANQPLAGAISFVARRRAELARDPKAAQQWAGALSIQERVLFAASSELTGILGLYASLRDILADAYARAGAMASLRATYASWAPMAQALDEAAKKSPKLATVPGLMPVLGVIDSYVNAAAVSHLHAQAPAALEHARQMKAMLPVSLAEDQIKSARAGVRQQREVEADASSLEPYADKTPAAIADQLQRSADLRLKAARGERLDPNTVEALSIDAIETGLRARLITLSTQAHTVMRKADDVGLPQGRHPSGAWSVHMITELIIHKVNGPYPQKQIDKNDHSGGGWHEHLDKAAIPIQPPYPQTIIAQRREAIKQVSAQFEIFSNDLNDSSNPDGKGFLQYAYDQIADQELRNLIVSMAIQIGIAIITGEVIGAVGAAVRGLTLAGEIGAELREVSLLYKGAEIVATAGANTLVQGAMGGKMGAREFAENALGVVLTSAALKPFQGILHDSAAVEGELQSWGRSAGRLGKVAAELVIDTGASIGAAGVAHAITHGGEMSQGGAEEWINMGLSIAASKFVHERVQGMKRRIQENKSADREHAQLLERVAALEQRSNLKPGSHPTPEQALELLIERRTLLAEELNFYKADPKSKKALDAKSDLAATGAAFAEVPLQLAHLSPVVEGHVYEGSQAEIQNAFHAADAIGVPLTREWLPEAGMWRIKSGERVIEIHERGGAGAKPHESSHPDQESKGSGKTKSVAEESLFKDISGDTEKLFQQKPGLKEVLAQYPEEADLFKLCHSTCFPDFLTPQELAPRLKRLAVIRRRAKVSKLEMKRWYVKKLLHQATDVRQVDEALQTLENTLEQLKAAKKEAADQPRHSGVADQPTLGDPRLDYGKGSPPIEAGAQGTIGAAAHARELFQELPQELRPEKAADLRQELLSHTSTLREIMEDLPPEGISELMFPTDLGRRFIDHVYFDQQSLTVVFRESKNVKAFRLTRRVMQQLGKDISFLGHPFFEGVRIEWRISGEVGAEVRQYLDNLRTTWGGKFNYVLDPPPPAP